MKSALPKAASIGVGCNEMTRERDLWTVLESWVEKWKLRGKLRRRQCVLTFPGAAQRFKTVKGHGQR